MRYKGYTQFNMKVARRNNDLASKRERIWQMYGLVWCFLDKCMILSGASFEVVYILSLEWTGRKLKIIREIRVSTVVLIKYPIRTQYLWALISHWYILCEYTTSGSDADRSSGWLSSLLIKIPCPSNSVLDQPYPPSATVLLFLNDI